MNEPVWGMEGAAVGDDVSILGIRMEFPEGLQEVRVRLGPFVDLAFDRTTAHLLNELRLHLPVVGCVLHWMELVYDCEWLAERQKTTMVDEYGEVEQLGDFVEVLCDDGEYRWGHVVTRETRPTGRKRPRVCEPVKVTPPPITFLTEKCDPLIESVDVPIRQKLRVSRNTGADYISRLERKHGFEWIDEDHAYITNVLRFREGLAGLQYVFDL